MAQLKALFKEQWESLVGLCDEFLYLGGNEKETHKYVSELMGKETLDTNTYGRSRGRSGSFSVNDQQTGRELLTPDEVRMLDNRKAILFVRGERPMLDDKYDLMRHPNIKLTEDAALRPMITPRRKTPQTISIILRAVRGFRTAGSGGLFEALNYTMNWRNASEEYSASLDFQEKS